MTDVIRTDARLRRRHRAERRFRLYGVLAVATGLMALAIMLVNIAATGLSAFRLTVLSLEFKLDPEVLGVPAGAGPAALAAADYDRLVKRAMRDLFPDVTSRRDRRALYRLVSVGAGFELREMALADILLVGSTVTLWVPASGDVDMLIKRQGSAAGKLNAKQRAWIGELRSRALLKTAFNWRFFASADSREPELAGILGAVVGSFYSLLVCLALSFPIGVMAAIYLETFASNNRWTGLLEVNINNLAAVPSIVFGLLGLAVFLNFLGMPRSAPLVGGIVLALMTLPTVIIATRAAIKAVPPTFREAALALGATPMQAVFHQVLPAAMPGVLTGSIIGMARALGETAPLLMIGMVAFIADIPSGPTDPSTALPVQIFIWAGSPERGFIEKSAAGILVLLGFLAIMNIFAVVLRRRFEQRW